MKKKTHANIKPPVKMQAVKCRKTPEIQRFSDAIRLQACSNLAQKSSSQSANGPIHPKKLGKFMPSPAPGPVKYRSIQTIALVFYSM